jgi:hypothetical protein
MEEHDISIWTKQHNLDNEMKGRDSWKKKFYNFISFGVSNYKLRVQITRNEFLTLPIKVYLSLSIN